MKKALALILAVIMCCGLLAACNGNDSSSSTAASTTAGTTKEGDTTKADDTTKGSDSDMKDVTLNVVTMFGGADSHTEAYRGINGSFETLTGAKISDKSQKSDDKWPAQVVADFNAGAEPDVLFFFNAANGEQIKDKCIDIATIQASYPEYAKNIKADVLNNSANVMSDSKTYCVPIKGFAEGVFCNKALFESAGVALDDIKTWDGLMGAIEKFNAKGITPISISLGAIPHYFYDFLMLSNMGTTEYNKFSLADSVKAITDIPESAIGGIALIKDLYDAKAFAADAVGVNADNGHTLFIQQKAAMYVDGSWHASASNYPIKPEKEEDVDKAVLYNDGVAFMPFPTKAGGEPTLLAGYTSGWYITKKAWEDDSKRDAAVKYVMTHTSDASIGMYCGPGIGGIPASATVPASESTDPLFTEVIKATQAYETCFPSQDFLSTGAKQQFITGMAQVAAGKMEAKAMLEAVYTEQLKG